MGKKLQQIKNIPQREKEYWEFKTVEKFLTKWRMRFNFTNNVRKIRKAFEKCINRKENWVLKQE